MTTLSNTHLRVLAAITTLRERGHVITFRKIATLCGIRKSFVGKAVNLLRDEGLIEGYPSSNPERLSSNSLFPTFTFTAESDLPHEQARFESPGSGAEPPGHGPDASPETDRQDHDHMEG